MGCAQSRIDNEESVSRCKERRNLMKEAVTARNGFAAGHSGYAIALKNTGAALSDYGRGEVLEESHHQSTMDPTSQTPQPPPLPPPPPPDMDHLPPSPPPLPEFSPSPMKRAMSLPTTSMDRKPGRRQIGSGAITEEDEEEEEEEEEVHQNQHHHEHNANVGNRNEKNMESKAGPQNTHDNGNTNNNNNNNDVRAPPPPPMPDAAWDYFFSVHNIPSSSLDASENDNRNENEENNAVEFDKIRNNNINKNDVVEPKTPEKAEKKVEVEVELEVEKGKQIEHSNTAPVEFRRVAKTVVSSVNLMELLSAIDDHFLKASETAQEVSKMLEATRLHYHSNFADNRGNWIGGLFY